MSDISIIVAVLLGLFALMWYVDRLMRKDDDE